MSIKAMSNEELIRQRLQFIDTYDQQIRALKNLRSEHTHYLENLAHAYHEAHPATAHPEYKLCCSAGYFVFGGANEHGIYFSTHCQYDGANAGNGITIPWDDVEDLAV